MKLLEVLGLKINLLNEATTPFGKIFSGAARSSIVQSIENNIRKSIDSVITAAGKNKIISSATIRNSRSYKDAMVKGVRELSQVDFGKTFGELAPDQQTATIKKVAAAAEEEMKIYSRKLGKDISDDISTVGSKQSSSATTGTKTQLKQVTKEMDVLTKKMNNGIKEMDNLVKGLPVPTISEFNTFFRKNSKTTSLGGNVIPPLTKKGLSYYYDFLTKSFKSGTGLNIKKIVINKIAYQTLLALGIVGAGIYLLYQAFGLVDGNTIIVDEDGNLIDPDLVSDPSLLNCVNNLIKNGAKLTESGENVFLLLKDTGNSEYDGMGGLEFYLNGVVKSGDGSKTGTWSCSLSGEATQTLSEQEGSNELTQKQISDVIASMDDQLSGDFFEGDSTDMQDALKIMKSIVDKTYRGESAISVVKKGYKRVTKSELISDVETKLKPSDFLGLEAQDELLSLLGGSSSSEDGGKVKKGKALDGITISWGSGDDKPFVDERPQPKFVDCENSSLPHKYGCISTKILDVQKCIGTDPDRYFGKNTRKALMDLEYDVTNGLTQEIYDRIMKNCNKSSTKPGIRLDPSDVSQYSRKFGKITPSDIPLGDIEYSKIEEDGESFYNKLKKVGSYFDGDLGKNRIKYKGGVLGEKDFKKLTQFFGENDYYHMKTKEKDDEDFKYVWKKR